MSNKKKRCHTCSGQIKCPDCDRVLESATIKEKISNLEDALGFYADDTNWYDVNTAEQESVAQQDFGEKAREALGITP